MKFEKNINNSDLIELIKKNKRLAFNHSYEEYGEEILHFIFKKIGDKKISEDLLHDVFEDLWLNLKNIKTNIYGYLINSAKYKIFNYYRSKEVQNKYLIHLSIFLDNYNNNDVINHIHAKEFIAEIKLLIAQLPKKCQKAFILSRFEHKKNSEIAQEMNISLRTVENYISTAMKHLKNNNIGLYLFIIIHLN